MGSSAAELTVLLQAWRDGSSEAFEAVARAVQAEFLRMAASRLAGHDQATFAKGDLVNEVWLRLMKSDKSWANRAHFFATAALTIRRLFSSGRVLLCVLQPALQREKSQATNPTVGPGRLAGLKSPPSEGE